LELLEGRLSEKTKKPKKFVVVQQKPKKKKIRKKFKAVSGPERGPVEVGKVSAKGKIYT